MIEDNNFLIIDGYGFIFRAYHVQPPLTSPTGQPVGAVYGFTSMLLKVLNDFKPKHAIIVLDSGGKNFRHELYSSYKANRPPAPQDLIDQLSLVRIAAQSLNFVTMEQKGYEADDIIASLAVKATKAKENAIIISADKDLMQLINGHIKMYDPLKSKYITPEDVIAKFGVGPDKVREVMALMGDSSDNIPGVPTVGPKTAAELIKQFGSVQEVLNNIDQIKSPRQREVMTASKQAALLSWQLVGLDENVPLDFNLDSFIWQPPPIDKISNFLGQYGFKSLYKRVENLFQVKLEHPAPSTSTASSKANEGVQEVSTAQQLGAILQKAQEDGALALYLPVHKNNPLVLCLASGSKSYVISFNSAPANPAPDLFSYASSQDKTINNFWFLPQIIAILEDKAIKKITYDLKSLLEFVEQNESHVKASACGDLKLLQYLLSAGRTQIDLMAEYDDSSTLEEQLTLFGAIIGGFEEQYKQLTTRAAAEDVLNLYKDIDLPLCYVLESMEKYGIKVDVGYLKQLSGELALEIDKLEAEIYKSSGVQFNIGSPKQLGEVLFEKMQLPAPKLSAKSKSYTTGAEILENLSEQGHQIADLILKWRQLTKLKNTYTDALPNHIKASTGRIHTTFLQTSTTTGRLSSVEPNLQNIPIRSIEGNKIRAAFIADSGHKLISADYSQIELRILSHMADIPALEGAFINGEDIHSQTAMRIFKVSKEELTPEHRRKAKAINFGIIYGISGFGLAKQLGISAHEGSQYVKKYLEEFPGIAQYMEQTIAYAHEHGFVKNLFGRRCYVPTINDKNHNLKQIGERAAINAPIQGTNADIIKIAMINIDKYLIKHQLKTKLILQIHDELLFEAPDDECEMIVPLIKDIMEKAVTLKVPIVVDTKIGSNWMDIH